MKLEKLMKYLRAICTPVRVVWVLSLVCGVAFGATLGLTGISDQTAILALYAFTGFTLVALLWAHTR